MDWKKINRKINGEWEAEYRLQGNAIETRFTNRYYPGNEYRTTAERLTDSDIADIKWDNVYNAITRHIATLLPYMDEDARLRSLLKNSERNMEAKGITRRETT